ncbi:MAG: thymidine phosphorylase [Cytophagales bacterium]|nr:thymidine phosphorylase [Cytophagales bacterium]
MRVVDIIQRKRDGQELTDHQIAALLDKYLKGSVPDYQVAAFLMAVYFRGMTDAELKTFTEKMMHSGDIIKFEGVKKFLVDKHSTGGVGDKVTIALAPLLAAFDIGTAKLSGKGLGHTGGTIDKLESIPGFVFPETREELVSQVNQTGVGIMGYSENIVPLDKRLYSLRDVTATVSSIPLIASSIMSKKLAVYADGIMLDVKVGAGAFMKTIEEARELAETMLGIGKNFDRKMVVHLTNMDQPLGCAVGNALEVIEAIETLKGKGPKEFTDLILHLTGTALYIKGNAKSIEEGAEMASHMIRTGEPLDKMKQFIKANGGDERIVNDYSLLPTASDQVDVIAKKAGFVRKIEAEEIGKAAMILGAGRATKESELDYAVGLVLNKKVGDEVRVGEVLATLYYNAADNLEDSIKKVEKAYDFSSEKVESQSVVLDTIKGF